MRQKRQGNIKVHKCTKIWIQAEDREQPPLKMSSKLKTEEIQTFCPNELGFCEIGNFCEYSNWLFKSEMNLEQKKSHIVPNQVK